MAVAVAGLGMMAGGVAAADKGRESEEYGATAQKCTVVQDWSYYRKCGDTGSEREPARAEPKHSREIARPTDNEPVGPAAAPND
jgi:hypothetical protein